MAYFDYFCDKCGKPFEIKAAINEDRDWVRCPLCGGKKIRRTYGGIYVPQKSGAGALRKSSLSGGSSCSSCSSRNCGNCG